MNDNSHGTERGRRPRVGLALGGGGARGYAHIGVIQVLQRQGVPIDIVVGTSMGAIIGGAFVSGLDLDLLKKVLASLDLNRLLGIPRNTFQEVSTVAGRIASEMLFKNNNWRQVEGENAKRLCQFFSLFSRGLSFADLKIEFAVIAADIDSGEEIVIREGPLSRAIAASSTVPGIHQPLRYNNRFLVDGGIVNKVPADVALRLGADVVIAIDVSAPLARGVTSSIEVLTQVEAITAQELVRTKLELVKREIGERLVILKPQMDNVSMLSLDQIETAARAGEEETLKRMPEIERALQRARVLISRANMK